MIDLALQKQRLQLKSAEQRGAMVAAAMQLAPAFAVADGLRDAWRWLRRNPEWLAGGIAVLLVVRPRAVWRLAQRSLFAWQVWRKLREWRASAPGTALVKLASLRRS
jgi:hypothetical protein